MSSGAARFGRRMKRWGALGAVVSAGVVWSAPFPAEACSPPEPPPGYGGITRTAPSDGATGVATDAAVVLDLELYYEPTVTVMVFDQGTTAPIAGSFQLTYWDRSFAYWVPAAPLQPETRYRVEAAVISQAARPAGAPGVPQLSFEFTTGAGPLPPIVSQGAMQARLETYQRERQDYSGCEAAGRCTSCGCGDCEPRRIQQQATRAVVTLPSFSGGQADQGYLALVYATAGAPYQFPAGADPSPTGVSAVGANRVSPNAPGETVIFDLDRLAGRPCFALQVSDLAGNRREVDPVCLDAIVSPPHDLDSGGCQVAGGAGSDGLAGCWVLVALVLMLIRAGASAPVRCQPASSLRRP